MLLLLPLLSQQLVLPVLQLQLALLWSQPVSLWRAPQHCCLLHALRQEEGQGQGCPPSQCGYGLQQLAGMQPLPLILCRGLALPAQG